MDLRAFAKIAGAIAVCLAVGVTASAQQYPGGPGGTGGTGMPGTGNSTGNYSYGNGKAIGIGVGAAAAAGVGAWLLIRHHRHAAEAKTQETSMTGCTESVLNQLSLRNEADNQTYLLLPGKISLRPGERVEVRGVVPKDAKDANAFRVRSLVNNYGGCGQGATTAKNTLTEKKEEALLQK